MRRLQLAAIAPFALLMAGCKAVVLNPSGNVALEQRDLLVQSAGLMLLIILPVMALTAFFAWRYRAGNKSARYEPNWDHSTQLELVIWGAPLLIIICLGALTWMGTHLLDPFRPLGHVEPGHAAAGKATPLEVDAVALDWKWLFIYPQYGIAAVNELAAPVDRPIAFRITASSVMNSFYIPALAGQIYAMPGMETKLHAVINKPGAYEGFSANYSGAGFSGMHFAFHGLDAAAFKKWMDTVKKSGGSLSRAAYLDLEQPSENVPVRTFASVDGTLYDKILNMCVRPGKMCVSKIMAIDAKGGRGLAGIRDVAPLEYDKYARPGPIVGANAQGDKARGDTVESDAKAGSHGKHATAATPSSSASAPIHGAGLPRPPYLPVRFRWLDESAGRRQADF